VTQLCAGQRVTVLQLPVGHPLPERVVRAVDTASRTTPVFIG